MRSRRVHARDVGLFAEEFELLDDCMFGAMRDGDLVCVKMVGPVGVGALKGGKVAMELDPPETEGVFFLFVVESLVDKKNLFEKNGLVSTGSGNDRRQCRCQDGLSENPLRFCRR